MVKGPHLSLGGAVNWGRGLFRIWMVISAIWVAIIFLNVQGLGLLTEALARAIYPSASCIQQLPKLGLNPFDCFASADAAERWRAFGVEGFALPISLLIAGLIGRWIARGFRHG